MLEHLLPALVRQIATLGASMRHATNACVGTLMVFRHVDLRIIYLCAYLHMKGDFLELNFFLFNKN